MQTGMAGILSRLIGRTWKPVPMTLRDVPAETLLLIKQKFQCTRVKIRFNPFCADFEDGRKVTSSLGESIICINSEISLEKTEITILGKKNHTTTQNEYQNQNQKKPKPKLKKTQKNKTKKTQETFKQRKQAVK